MLGPEVRHSLVAALLLSLATLGISCKEDNSRAEVKRVDVKFKKEGTLQLKKSSTDSILANLEIEIADDSYQTETGLMYRKSMANNRGMLFIFPNLDYRSFYMKNTEFGLDIIYLDQDQKIVSIQKNAEPQNETSLPSEAPAKYVLEVNAGLSDQWGLEKGDVMTYSRD